MLISGGAVADLAGLVPAATVRGGHGEEVVGRHCLSVGPG
jgi:hypothetical protein